MISKMSYKEESGREKTKLEEGETEKHDVLSRSINGNSSVLVSTRHETADCRRTLLHKYLDSCRISGEPLDHKKEVTFDDNCSENSLDVSISEYDSEEVESNGDSFENGFDSEITNVSSLPSNFNSPMPSPKFIRRVPKTEETLTSDNKSERTKIPCYQGVDIEQLKRAIVEIDEHRRSKNLSENRMKILAFSKDDGECVDTENQHIPKPISKEKMKQRDPLSDRTKINKPTTRTISRLVKQKKIEVENLSLLKRIQTAKPSRGISRAHYNPSTSLPHSHSTSCASKPQNPAFNKSLKHSSSAEDSRTPLNITGPQDHQPSLDKNASSHFTTKAARSCGGPKIGMNKMNGKIAGKLYCTS